MLQYRSFEEIIDHPGLRIVLVKGMPSPWGQAAKTIFEIKGLDYVAEELGNDLEFRHSMWRLDILQDPKRSVLAAPALAEADMLIISLRGEGQLPAKIRALIDEQLAQTVNHQCALVALFEGAAPATRSSVYACLATLAQRHGLDFFEQALSDAEDHEESSLKLIWVF